MYRLLSTLFYSILAFELVYAYMWTVDTLLDSYFAPHAVWCIANTRGVGMLCVPAH
jgi:hypothetical protein